MAVAGDHAIVVGGSAVGLPAAMGLRRHFATVTVVERDFFPDGPVDRRGVPQSAHLHGLLCGGRVALDEIYGGGAFTEAMRASGAHYYDFAQHQAFRFPEGWIKRAPGDLMWVTATRRTIEHVLRLLTTRVDGIVIRDGETVEDLVFDASGTRVIGVRTRTAGETSVLRADLVVDAGGRGSQSVRWLEAHGYAPPVEAVVQSFLGYATVHGFVPDDVWPGDLRSIGAAPFPGQTRGGFVLPEEDGLTGIMAAGQSRDYPPAERRGFTEFLRTGVTPALAEIWERCEPATPIRTTKSSQNRLRLWHELDRRPDGFLAIGDAVAAYNPVYGQGITAGAIQVRELGRVLLECDHLAEAVAAFPARAMAVSGFAWSAATGSDLQFPATVATNHTAAEDPAAVAYLGRLRRAATVDAGVARAFEQAWTYLDGVPLFAPELVARVEEVCASELPPADEGTWPPAHADGRSALLSE